MWDSNDASDLDGSPLGRGGLLGGGRGLPPGGGRSGGDTDVDEGRRVGAPRGRSGTLRVAHPWDGGVGCGSRTKGHEPKKTTKDDVTFEIHGPSF